MTTHDGRVLQQFAIENRICELLNDFTFLSDIEIGDEQTALRTIRQATIKAEMGRTKLSNDQLEIVLDMLRANGDAWHAENIEVSYDREDSWEGAGSKAES